IQSAHALATRFCCSLLASSSPSASMMKAFFSVLLGSSRLINLYSALCTEGSVRSELSSTFTVYQPHYQVCAAASTGIGSTGLSLNHVGGTRGATRWTLSSTIDANLTS